MSKLKFEIVHFFSDLSTITTHSVQGYTFIEENFPGLFTADTGLPQALDDIKSKKNQFQRSKNFT